MAAGWLGILAAFLATGALASQLALSWTDASNNEDGFKIERALACGTFTQVATVGANVTTYIDTGLAPSTLYCYRLRAFNAVGDSAYSNVASATTSATNTAPAITTQPATQTVTAGANVSFTVVASGTAPLTYQWRKAVVNLTGATSATYSMTSVQTASAGTYSVVVSNVAGSVTSANATLTVNAAAVAPAITTQPVTQTVTAGANVSFTVVASGTAPLTYQWRKAGVNLTGATSATYSMTSVQTANAGSYSVVVANPAGSVTSANVTLTVNAAALTAPTGLTSVAGNAQVALSWTATSGATSYIVKRATVSGGPYTTVASGVTTTGYTNTGLLNGTTYYYVVSAVSAGGESPNSTAVIATPGSLPSPWQTRDIGTVLVGGAANYTNSTYTVKGAGADIWGTTDAFRFMYQTGTGDCDIRVRVMTVQNANAWSKAGVMIRETLNANARHAMVVVTPGNGVAFQRRTSTGGSSADTHTTGLAAPYWVRVVRTGDLFTAYRSTNSTSWVSMGSVTNVMGTSVYIGLAVTSHNSATLCTATFDNLGVTP